MSLAIANHNIQTSSSLLVPLTDANYDFQSDHPFWIPLTETNHNIHIVSSILDAISRS
jgi:hypothetical protein